MDSGGPSREVATRRRVLAGGGAVLSVGVAGCVGGADDDSADDDGTGSDDGSGTDGGSTDGGDGSADGGPDAADVTASGAARMFGYDPGRRAHASGVSGPAGGVAELWTHEFPTETYRTMPTVVDGVAYAYGHDGTVVALDAATGEEQWTTELDASGPEGLAAPVATPDGLYLNGDGLWALDPETGETIWQQDVQGSAGVLSHEDGVLYGTENLEPAAWDAASGERLWHHRIDGYEGTFDTAVGEEFVFRLNLTSFHTFAIEKDTGETRWEVDFFPDGFQDPGGVAFGHGRLYVTDVRNDRLFAVDPAAGEVDWERELRVFRRPAVGPDAVYAASVIGETLYRVDPETGEDVGEWAADDLRTYSQPVVTDERVYVWGADSDERDLFAYDAASGEQLWRHGVGAPAVEEVSVLDDLVLYADGERIVALAEA